MREETEEKGHPSFATNSAAKLPFSLCSQKLTMTHIPQKPDDLEQLGWGAETENIAAHIQRLNVGHPREDEFSVIYGRLGCCAVIHKLDQKQTPEKSTENYQVPDLFAVSNDGCPSSVMQKDHIQV